MLQVKDMNKSYSYGDQQQSILQNVNLSIEKGEMVAIMGTSGAGKSTLLHILGLLDTPDNGSYFLNGIRIRNEKEKKKAQLRNQYLGFVFQDFHLIKELTAIENVQLALQISNIYNKKKISRKRRVEKSSEILKKVGLENCLDKKPSQLSGGQKQRVAIARALVNEPNVILADEPTGALDSYTSKEIIELFCELNREGHTIVIVTHDKEVAAQCGRIVKIVDGRCEEYSDTVNKR